MEREDAQRYARHILLPDVGGIGQRALLDARARVDETDEAGAIAALYLRASGVTVENVRVHANVDVDVNGSESPWYRGSLAATRFMARTIDDARDPVVAVSSAILDELYAIARAAHPHEACGYLVGPRDADRVDALVACANRHPEPSTRYRIDGRELFDFARSLRSPRPAKIVYHSHVNGRAYFSPTDQDAALADDKPVYPVQHLVIGDGVAALFAYSRFDARYVERWRTPA